MLNSAYRYEDLLETVACNLCGDNNYEVIYPPRYDAADPEEIVNTFRSSGDEILVDRLVRCKQCGLQYFLPPSPGNRRPDAHTFTQIKSLPF